MDYLFITLVAGGAMLQLASLILVRKLIRELPRPYLRTGWKILSVFILFFFASYLSYLFFLQTKTDALRTIDLLVPSILFFGAVFVLVANLLSLKTTLD
ncbi:MAG TPA: GGDEF domain-containing protein, partial [Desulfurivibrio alkaliphilus]|nr:GGDEF domain-containing protein [Desulfurivibrio alkaliphilus]